MTKFVIVKDRLHIKKVGSLLSIFGLALLILLSPCKVRHFIQAELEVDQTQVLNKNQTTVSQSSCQAFEYSKIVKNTAKPTFHQPGNIPAGVYSNKFTNSEIEHFFTPTPSVTPLLSNIPLYILHQNIKIYT